MVFLGWIVLCAAFVPVTALGTWIGAERAHPRSRSVAVAGSVVVIFTRNPVMMMAACAALGTAAYWFLRRVLVDAHILQNTLHNERNYNGTKYGCQFSVRHILIATAAVAVVLTLRVCVSTDYKLMVAVPIGFVSNSVAATRWTLSSFDTLQRDYLVVASSVVIGSSIGWIIAGDDRLVFPFGLVMILHGGATGAFAKTIAEKWQLP